MSYSRRGLMADPRQASEAQFEQARIQAAERATMTPEQAGAPLLPGFLGDIQMGGQELIRGTQKVGGEVVKGATGIDLSPAAIQEQSLLEQAAETPGDLFGGFMKGLGIDPKLLLIGGVAAIGLIVLVMVLK